MSALPLKADIGTQSRNVRFVPKADIGRCGWRRVSTAYSVAQCDVSRRTTNVDDRGEVSESAGVVKPRVHLAVRLPRPHMTHDDEWRVRQEH